MSRILLIPSAKLLPPELQCDFGQIPSAMVPLAGRPALWHISKPYVSRGFEVVVAAQERAECIERYLACCPDFTARTVRVGPVQHLGDTVLRVLEKLGACDELVVNFGDTLVADGLLAGDQFYLARDPDLFRWTTFRLDERGCIGEVVDRNQPKKANGQHARVFVGAFAFADPARFLSLLRKYASAPEPELDYFYSAVRDYYGGLEQADRAAREARQWFDLGHLDTYYSARQRCFLGEREFNSMEVDRRRGTLIKRSHDPKLLQEIGWYLGLPPALTHVAPRIFRYSRDPHDAFVEMEFYGYPLLSEAYVFGQLDQGVWKEIFHAIAFVLASMQEVQTASVPEALVEMYVNKTRMRLQRAMESPHLAPLCWRRLLVNGTRCMSIGELLDDLPETAERLGLLSAERFTVIHGDLCLANILYDRRSGIVRLVDPRGCFGAGSIYGDPRYDLAKLSHSFHGSYDFLVNGLFTLRGSGAEYELIPHEAEHHRAIAALFSQLFLPGRQALPVRLIESTLFLGMVPLHSDRPRAQQAFLLQGLRLYSEIRAQLRKTRALTQVPATLAACTS